MRTGEQLFVDQLADRLAGLPTVEAVALGGSRAQGTARPDSDWDLAVYYRGDFDPQHLRDLGWPGDVSPIGGWGGGVFNGGAWLQVDGRAVDVHYRDLDSVHHELAEAQAGRFGIEPLLFHLAGIPTYLVVAELALNQVLRGRLPVPEYPAALRRTAPDVWWSRAEMIFGYAGRNHASQGRLAACAGLTVQAAFSAAHAIAAAGGIWVTNEKRLAQAAGLDGLDALVAELVARPAELVDAVQGLCRDRLTAVGAAAGEGQIR